MDHGKHARTEPRPVPDSWVGERTDRFLVQNMIHGLACGRVWFEAGQPVDFVFLDVNPAFRTQTGMDDVVGRWASEVLESFGRVASTGRPEAFEACIGGLDRWLSISIYSPNPEHVVALFEDISARKHHEAQIERMAYYDALTELPNRVLACARAEHALHRAQRRGGMVAVLFLDLDGFKQVNDAHGHREGDRLLREVARRLRGRVRAEDTLARLGGDELLVVMETLTDEDEAAILADGLNEVMRAPFLVEGRESLVTTSIGIALYPRDGKDTHALFDRADAAFYRAKQEGGNRHVSYARGFKFRDSEPSSSGYEVKWAIERATRRIPLHCSEPDP